MNGGVQYEIIGFMIDLQLNSLILGISYVRLNNYLNMIEQEAYEGQFDDQGDFQAQQDQENLQEPDYQDEPDQEQRVDESNME